MVRATQKKKDKKEEKQVASLHSRSAEFWIIYFSYTTCTGEHLFAHTWHFINLFFYRRVPLKAETQGSLSSSCFKHNMIHNIQNRKLYRLHH